MQPPTEIRQAFTWHVEPSHYLRSSIKYIVVMLACLTIDVVDASAFGKLLRIGVGGVDPATSSLTTFIRGRYARTVIADTFPSFTNQRNIYGVCVPVFACVTKVRVFCAGAWKDMRLSRNDVMWSPGKSTGTDYGKALFPWVRDKRRDYFVFEFSVQSNADRVIVETTYEEVIPMYGNKWTYRVPFGWNVGGSQTPVTTWSVDVETDQNYGQPAVVPVMSGIRIEGRHLKGIVDGPITSGEPVIECIEHPDHRNTSVRDSYSGQQHLGAFMSPTAALNAPGGGVGVGGGEGAVLKGRVVSIVLPDLKALFDAPQSRLFIDALLARLGPNDYINIWSNSSTPASIWKKPHRAHDDNVYAIPGLMEQLTSGAPLNQFKDVLDSVRMYDANDSMQHVVVLVAKTNMDADVDALNRFAATTEISHITMGFQQPTYACATTCKVRGGVVAHIAAWYSWRAEIPATADSCLGISVDMVGTTTPGVTSPEPPTSTALIQGSRRVVYSYDDGRTASTVRQEFAGLIARTWANERINRMVDEVHKGVSDAAKTEIVAEVQRLGMLYQIWTAFNPLVE